MWRNSNLWDEMCEIIKWHNEQQPCCVDTVNRLWRKDPFISHPDSLPVLSRAALRVEAEEWHLDRLWKFICEKRRTDLVPAASDMAIVTLRWSGEDYLIDGRRRINAWHRQ